MNTLVFVLNALLLCFAVHRVGSAVERGLLWGINKALNYIFPEPPGAA